MFALNLLLETAEHPVLQMLEAFILPVVSEIALFNSDKRDYSKTSQYFKQKGYPGTTPNIEQLSHNYILLATDFVFVGAAIKPQANYYNDLMNTESGFKVLADKLAGKGL
jgi:hypothetical protein